MQKIIFLDKQEADDLPPGASEEERVEAAVRWINRKVQSTVHFGLLQIGYYLLNTFFGGSVEEALSRNPHKQHSFRRLCRRPDLLISSTHLVSSVKLVVQEKQLGEDRDFQKLAVSHKIALLGVGSLETKRALARRAAGEGLSVRALNGEVRRLRGGEAGDDSRRWLRRLRRALDEVQELAQQARLEDLSPTEVQALDRAVSETRRRLQATLATLRGIRSIAV
jgi:hypothetical protein